MTTYILHWGYYRRDSSDNRTFFKEIEKYLQNESQILFIPFAREKSCWQEKMEEFNYIIKKNITEKKINLVLASEDKEVLINQIKLCDIVFITGGDENQRLYNYLSIIPNLINLFKGKLVVWSSAWTQILSKYYARWKSDGIYEGLGILPIKVIVHWTEDQWNKFKKLDANWENLEIYKIPEEKYVVLKI